MSTDSIFDLTGYNSVDLERLEMGINSGIVDARKVKLKELEETLNSFLTIVQLAKRMAIEKESEQFAANTSREIKEGIFDKFKGLNFN